MGWDQVSLHIYAPGAEPEVSIAPNAMTWTGEPLKIVGDRVIEGFSGKLTGIEEAERWLIERGCEVFDRTKTPRESIMLYRGPRLRGDREIEINLYGEAGVLRSLYCRFALSSDAPQHLLQWEELMIPFCERFQLTIMDRDQRLCPATHLARIVRSYPNWLEFARHHGWPSEDDTQVL